MKANLLLLTTAGVICLTLRWLIPVGHAQQAPAEPAVSEKQSKPSTDSAAITAPKQPDVSVDESKASDGAKPAAEDEGSFWMDQKLRLSKEILTGLAKGDFPAVRHNAELMRGLNRVEKFVRRSPENYRDYLKQFNMATNELIRYSQEENLEGATLAFNQLTICCVTCHKHLREAK